MQLPDPAIIAASPRQLRIDAYIVELQKTGKLHERWTSGHMPRADLGAHGNVVMSVIAAGQLGAEWQAAAPALSVGRRALEVSVRMALNALGGSQQATWLKDWDVVIDSAERARSATKSFINTLGNGFQRQLGSRALERPLFQMENATSPSGVYRIEELSASVAKKADALALALAVMEEFHDFATKRRTQIAANRTKRGEPEKNAFVSGMAQAWIFLSGSLPGTGPVRNPFMEFASQAWQDAGGDHGDSLINAVRLARKSCPPVTPDGPPPAWL